MGACAGGATPREPKPSPRAPMFGDSNPFEGLEENSEFDCAKATPGKASPKANQCPARQPPR